MLVESDAQELGDKRLNPEENNVRLREELIQEASQYKIGGQSELEDAERSAGPRLGYREIIRRLRKANPAILVVDGSPGSVAIYIPKNRSDYDESDEMDGHRYSDHKYVSGMLKQEMPEYPHVILDASHLPVREIRGWRSVLIMLIKAGALTYSQAVTQFGEAVGQRSYRWHAQLAKFK